MTANPILRWLLYIISFLIALIAICILVIRFIIFPNINDYKADIANYVGSTLQRKVNVGNIQTGWHRLSPRITLKDVSIFDEENRPALNLQQIDTELSWLSLGVFDLRLAELTAHQPNLIIRRTKDNVFFLAGINVSGRGNPKFANWLISQSHVSIRDAKISYIDELRQAPPLSLSNLNLSLSNASWRSLLGRHLFTISAMPSVGSQQKIEVNGYFVGNDINNSAQWYGELHTSVKETDLTVWKPWLDYPIEITKGTGAVEATLDFGHNRIEKLHTALKLNQLMLVGKNAQKPVDIQQLTGNIDWYQNNQELSISTKNLNLITNTGLEINQATGQYVRTQKNKQANSKAHFSIAHLSLSALKNTVTLFKIPDTLNNYLNAMDPTGDMHNLTIDMVGNGQDLSKYQVKADFSQLSANAYQTIPGFINLTGAIDANENNGQISFNTKKASVNLKGILRWPVPIDHLQGRIDWTKNNDKTIIKVNDVLVDNAHLSGRVDGEYALSNQASDEIDISATFTRADAKNANFYYPNSIGQDSIEWLDKSIIKGDLSDIKVTLKGKVNDFPFVDQEMKPDHKKGILKVSAQLNNGEVKFAEDWPAGKDLSASLVFESLSMTLNATKGHMLGQQLVSANINIPNLDADWPILNAVGITKAPMQEAINYINNSPVKNVTLGFTDTLKTAGNGQLKLEVNVPLKKSIDTTFKGIFNITNGTLYANADVGTPELSQVNGALSFDDHGIHAEQLKVMVAGGPATMNLISRQDKTIIINASGLATDIGLRKTFNLDILKPLEGRANWNGEISIKKPNVNITINSDLKGMAINAPAPMNKQAETSSQFVFNKIQSDENHDVLAIEYEDTLKIKLARTEKNNEFEIEKGIIAFNQPAEFNSKNYTIKNGIVLNADVDNAKLEDWIDFISRNELQSESNDGVRLANLYIKDLNVFERSIKNIKVAVTPNKEGLQLVLNSENIAGNAQWISKDNGKIIARLNTLKIPKSAPTPVNTKKVEMKRLAKEYPALDIESEVFELGDKHLGSLALNAFESGNSWIIQKLNITSPEHTLVSEGTWHNWTRNPNTYLHFNFNTKDIGKSLVRFDEPNTVKGGKAKLSGTLQWPGSPHQFDAQNINGNIQLEAKDGQILKVKPGVGRLLGLISLQSLPRRLTLDFSDLFSEGFAFDDIHGSAIASNGVLSSNDFTMTGPAAEVNMSGETNLKTETQNLKVKVIPHISDSLSLAAWASGPIAGVAAFGAQKLLKDSLNKIVSSEYIITGTWDNPQEIESNKDKPKEDVIKPLQ